jgi:hypothetical protein
VGTPECRPCDALHPSNHQTAKPRQLDTRTSARQTRMCLSNPPSGDSFSTSQSNKLTVPGQQLAKAQPWQISITDEQIAALKAPTQRSSPASMEAL